MRRTIALFTLFILSIQFSFAHFIWIETNQKGSLNKEHQINVFFGEFAHDIKETTSDDAFNSVKDFELWLVDHQGQKTILSVTPERDHYTAKFTPTKKGSYTIILNNNNIDVIDYTKYDFGIFKTHYHATAKIDIDTTTGKSNDSNDHGISINNISDDDENITLEITYQKEMMSNTEVKLFLPQGWTKTMETNEKGNVSFQLPWESTYVIEITAKEEVPGTFNGDDYEFIYHCTTFSIEN